LSNLLKLFELKVNVKSIYPYRIETRVIFYLYFIIFGVKRTSKHTDGISKIFRKISDKRTSISRTRRLSKRIIIFIHSKKILCSHIFLHYYHRLQNVNTIYTKYYGFTLIKKMYSRIPRENFAMKIMSFLLQYKYWKNIMSHCYCDFKTWKIYIGINSIWNKRPALLCYISNWLSTMSYTH